MIALWLRFHFGVSMGPEEIEAILKALAVAALVIVILAYAAYRWLRGTVERIF